jgi:hypothetical protein
MELRWNNLFLLSWAGLILYSILLPPGSPGDSLDLLKEMISNPTGVEPMVMTVFNLMGVWPMAFAAVLLFEGRGSGLRSWPFVIGSFFAGAFSLLPYLGLRSPHPEFSGEKGFLLKILDSRTYGIILKITGISLLAYGLGAGDPSEYLEMFRTNMLVHVMTLDLLALTMVFPYVMYDDMRRRGWYSRKRFLLFSLVPLIGPLTYLWTRPRLRDTSL